MDTKIKAAGSIGTGTTLVGTGTNPVLWMGTGTTCLGTGTTSVMSIGTGTTLVWVSVPVPNYGIAHK